MALREMVSEERLVVLSGLSAVNAQDVQRFLDGLDAELPGMLQKIICTFGYQAIDEEREREDLTGRILDGLATIIPPQYVIIWTLVRPVVGEVVREILDQAAEQGTAYCEGVTSILLPFPVRA